MYCDECGHELDANGICPICGYIKQNTFSEQPQYTNPNTFNQQAQYTNPNTFNQQPQYGSVNSFNMQPPAQAPKSNNKKRIYIASGVIAALLITIITVYFISNSNIKDYTKDGTNYVPSTESSSEATTTSPPSTEAPLPSGSEAEKTIMVYLVGSDLESDYSAATSDLNEMMDSDFDDENINLLIYAGGCTHWNIDSIQDNENTTLIIKNGRIEKLASEPQRNMGSPDTLTDFLTYGYENYPAEQYSIIFWNHGGGAFSGYGYDEITSDSLTLKELSEAFAASPFNENNKLEWVGFDACLMATIEIADALSPYANYLISSQEPEPSWGWDYSFLSDISGSDNGVEIGTKIVDSYIETSEYNFSTLPFSYSNITLSVLDLNRTADVEAALNGLFIKADGKLDNTTFARYSKIRSRTKEIASMYTGDYSYDVVDMVDLSNKMEAEFQKEAEALEDALDSFIVYNRTNETDANGVSVYYPYNAKTYSSYYLPMYQGFDFATDYAKYISNFNTLLTGSETLTAEWDAQTMIPVANEDLSFNLQLTPEQAANCQNAYYVISRADTEHPGSYIFVSMSNQVELDSSNLLTADFDGQIIYMQNDTTNEQYEVMYTEQEATSSYTRYLLSSVLFDESIEEEDAMYAYFVLETTDNNPKGEILGAYPIANLISGNGTEIFPERYEINLSEYNNIAFGSFTHEFTSDEDLTNFNESDWSDLVLNYNQFPISDGFSTTLGGMIPNIPYFGMFVIEDTQGNRHCSNLVQLK